MKFNNKLPTQSISFICDSLSVCSYHGDGVTYLEWPLVPSRRVVRCGNFWRIVCRMERVIQLTTTHVRFGRLVINKTPKWLLDVCMSYHKRKIHSECKGHEDTAT